VIAVLVTVTVVLVLRVYVTPPLGATDEETDAHYFEFVRWANTKQSRGISVVALEKKRISRQARADRMPAVHVVDDDEDEDEDEDEEDEEEEEKVEGEEEEKQEEGRTI